MLLDLRFAVRTLRRMPGFTLAAVLTIAVGIGSSTAIFSVVNGVLFKPVDGLDDTRGLVEISRRVGSSDYFSLSYPAVRYFQEHTERLEDLAAMELVALSLDGNPEPTVHTTLAVTGNYFSLLRLLPAAGRFFTAAEASYPDVSPVAVISHRLWEDRFGASPEVLGRTIRVNGHPVEVVGVAGEGFTSHFGRLAIDLYVPVGLPAPGLASAAALGQPNSGMFDVIGRLAPGASAAEAENELTVLGSQFIAEHSPAERAGSHVANVQPWAPVPATVRPGAYAFLLILMVVVGLAVTIACTNVASMILARSAARRRELATRAALGAGRGRLVSQVLTESLLLVTAGAVVGVLGAVWATRLLMAFEPALPLGLSVVLDTGLDWRVLLFTLGVSLLSGAVVSFAPASQASTPDLVTALKDTSAGGPARARLRNVIVAAQMSVVVLLLLVAGLFLRALGSVESLDTGWESAGVYTMSLNLEYGAYDDEAGRRFYGTLTERLRSSPGLEAGGLAGKLPLAGRSSLGDINVTGVEPPDGRIGFTAFLNTVSPGYFDTVRIGLVQGRDFSDSDTTGSQPVAVINRAMADRFWPSDSPVGQRFYTGRPGAGTVYDVIGVVENAKYSRLDEETPNFYYLPVQQRYNSEMTIHFRPSVQGESAVVAVRQLVRDLDPALPVNSVGTLTAALDLFFLPQRLASWVTGVLGVVGLLLGAIGVYGVTAFAIAQRTREVGVRIALGATRGDVRWLMVRQGLWAPLLGMAAGLAVAVAVTRFLRSFLAGVSPVDPITFAAVIAVLAGVAVCAVSLPATRASRLDPMKTLRSE
jgi:predicted permease